MSWIRVGSRAQPIGNIKSRGTKGTRGIPQIFSRLTDASRFPGSPSMIVLKKLTNTFTILILLRVLFTKTKHLVKSAYEESPPSFFQCACSSLRYFDGANVRGSSSKGIVDDIASSTDEVDCRARVVF